MTYHYNKENVYLKRPHIGFTIYENSLVRKTKDHIYYEHICLCKKTRIKNHHVLEGRTFDKYIKVNTSDENI